MGRRLPRGQAMVVEGGGGPVVQAADRRWCSLVKLFPALAAVAATVAPLRARVKIKLEYDK